MRIPCKALTLGFAMTLVLASPAAAAVTTTVLDPIGDTAVIAGPASTPAYLDIVSTAVSNFGGSFEFV